MLSHNTPRDLLGHSIGNIFLEDFEEIKNTHKTLI